MQLSLTAPAEKGQYEPVQFLWNALCPLKWTFDACMITLHANDGRFFYGDGLVVFHPDRRHTTVLTVGTPLANSERPAEISPIRAVIAGFPVTLSGSSLPKKAMRRQIASVLSGEYQPRKQLVHVDYANQLQLPNPIDTQNDLRMYMQEPIQSISDEQLSLTLHRWLTNQTVALH